jgi:rieske iron-sulfur protein
MARRTKRMSELTREMRMRSPATDVIECAARSGLTPRLNAANYFSAASFWPGSTFQFVASESDQRTATSLAYSSAECGTPMSSSSDQTRRTLLLTALAAATSLTAGEPVFAADEDQPGSDERPQKADVLVVSEGEHAGDIVKPQDLQLGGPPVRAWPKDPKTSVVRKGSRLNEVLVIKLDPAELDDQTRARSADGIVAYSAICTHAGCPVTAWVKADGGDKDVFKCVCHNSEYDPRQSADVVFGPAPRRLAALPLTTVDGTLTIAANFVGKVGTQQAG